MSGNRFPCGQIDQIPQVVLEGADAGEGNADQVLIMIVEGMTRKTSIEARASVFHPDDVERALKDQR